MTTRIEWDSRRLRPVEIRSDDQGHETSTPLDPATGIRLDESIEDRVVEAARATAQRILDEFSTDSDPHTKLAVVDEANAMMTMLRLARSFYLSRVRNDVETGEQP